jgi:hypothetical protein
LLLSGAITASPPARAAQVDDFHSSGRISGTKRIPLSKLEAGEQYTIDSQRLEVNHAVDRYKKEIKGSCGGFLAIPA